MQLKKILVCIVSILLCLSPALSLAQDPDNILYMTENYPPYNFVEKNQLKGISVDLMVLMLEKLGSKKTREDIRIFPWPRGYQGVLNRPDTCLFAMTRTEEREKLFKWVGPFYAEKIVLIARKGRQIKISSIEDLVRYKIGVVSNDVGELVLAEKKVPRENIFPASTPEQNANKLGLDRIDMWAYGRIVGMRIIRDVGLNPQDFEIVYSVSFPGDNYFAFHRDIPDQLIEKFQQALDELKAQGTYQEILDRYLK